MGHQISFQDVENGWYNALPLGNGKMGAMVYYRDRSLHVALNHYDCYYHILPQYAQNPGGAYGAAFEDPARQEKTYGEIRETVRRARMKPSYERSHYLRVLNPSPGGERPQYKGSSYPQGGEVVIRFSEAVDISHSSLILSIEEARVEFTAGVRDNQVRAGIYVSRDFDGVVLELFQETEGLWEEAFLWRQEARGQDSFSYEDCREEGMSLMWCRFRPEGENRETEAFVQETALLLPGAGKSGCLGQGEKKWTLVGSICGGKGKAVETARRLWNNLEREQKVHRDEWKSFWRSHVELPDYYLETLWYLHVYLLECGNGRGSVHSEQAVGLSGLWDIRRPCMWGSMWYWDVNIQTAFYGVFGSNHLEAAECFCEGFLSYAEEARRFGERIYGERGWALDYPHPLYHCIQPWCALFLWKYYIYTRDEEFLKEKAYPVFLEILDFYKKITWLDGQGVRHMELDISPEQGPVGEDCTATTAAVKQLLQYARKGAEILNRPREEKEMLAQLFEELPPYALTADRRRLKDSKEAQDQLFLRHPSLLMPVFPGEEIHMDSSEDLKILADETIRYAAENTEAGTFGFSWLALAAARMGAGESVVRILYEKGLDFLTRTNGLGYEETERFTNYCHLTKPAHYLPAMCEFSGGVTAAVNLMLLQEIDGIIRVFPAVPDGKDRYEVPKTQYCHDTEKLTQAYGPWEDCGFDGLLAPGGFEISARLRQGKVVWLQIFAPKGERLRMHLPQELSKDQREKTLEKVFIPGETLCYGKKPDPILRPEQSGVLKHRSAVTHRRTFLGEDRHTGFYKALDSMVCPYGFGEDLRYPMTPYVFDFTQEIGKNYDEVYESQIIRTGRTILMAGGPRRVGRETYSPGRGYGFLNTQGLDMKEREGPDPLRKDFVEGEFQAEFGVELPAGKYDLLVVSGDEEEASLTHLSLPDAGLNRVGKVCMAGQYQARILPVVHEEDGILRLTVSTEPGKKWKLNAMVINKEFMFL